MSVKPQRLNLYLRLLAVPLVLSLIDAGVTLHYQPSGYWNGDRSQLIEFNPLVWVALRIHPVLLVPGFLGWYALASWLMFWTPAWIGLRLHVILVLTHLIAIAGWLIRHHEHGLALTAFIWIAAIGVDAALCLRFRPQWNGLISIQPSST